MNRPTLFFIYLNIAASLLASASFAALPSSDKNNLQDNPSTDTSELDYGEMYLVQKREKNETLWQASLNYSYGYSNPYIGIHGIQLNLNHKVNDFFYFGLSPSYYLNSKKDVAAELTQKLSAQNIQTDVYEPTANLYANASVAPLSGLLNWFGKSTVSFDMFINFGAGFAKYKQDSRYLPSLRIGILPQAMLTKNIGFTIGVQATFDRFSGNDWQNRMDTIAGLVGRF